MKHKDDKTNLDTIKRTLYLVKIANEITEFIIELLNLIEQIKDVH